ncbi:MAG TPA: polysaccharide biosynthesis tyrosine autokinase [Gemmataceae bacterium]|nr:polysaccharide biosynthesis tyrosine autokinase [Gemmataceae bacterium]
MSESGETSPANPANPLIPVSGPVPVSAPHAAVHPRSGVGRHGLAPIPPGLTRAPNALLLLKALQRRWLLAGSIGLLLAAAAGSGVFFYMPPPKHSVRTLIHAPPQRGIVFKQPGSYGDLSNHQRTQVAMFKSRLVLNSALRDPKVVKLSIVQGQIEPVEWLEKEVKADFSVAPEVLRISMSGDKPEQLVVLVDALAQAYRREIVDNEKNQRRERLNMLRELREKYEGQLRERQKTQREIERSAGGRDVAARALVLSFERQHLAMAERELLQMKFKLLDARQNLELQQSRGKKTPELTIPDILVDEQIDRSPAIAKLLAQAEKLKESLEKDRAALVNPEKFAPYQANSEKMKKVQADLAEQREKLRPRIVQQLRDKLRARTAETSGALQASIPALEGIEKILIPEVERLRTVVQDLAKNGSKLDAFRDDISHIENLTQRLINEEQALNVEMEAPSEFKILEEAQILHAQTQSRMAMMTTGAALGATAAGLLAVAFWEFRRRRIDSVEDVADELGIRVVGALPNSSRRLPRRLIGGGSQDAYLDVLLTESIDATRTMLLHLARCESAQVVMVTSATAGEGKTSLACHMAASMARMGLKTLLIDADLRNPTTHRLFEVHNEAGLSELLLGEEEVGNVIQPTPVNGLSLLPAGVWDSHVSQLLAKSQTRTLFEQLRKHYDFILVDSPPVLPVADALLIGQVVDAVIFSVLCEVSRLPSVYMATQRMAALGIRSLGAVVNGVHAEPYISSSAYTSRAQGKVENEVSA